MPIHMHWLLSLHNIFLDTLTSVPFQVSQAFTLEQTTPKLHRRLIL